MTNSKSEFSHVLDEIDIYFFSEILSDEKEELLKLPFFIEYKRSDDWRGATSGTEY